IRRTSGDDFCRRSSSIDPATDPGVDRVVDATPAAGTTRAAALAALSGGPAAASGISDCPLAWLTPALGALAAVPLAAGSAAAFSPAAPTTATHQLIRTSCASVT